MESRSKEKALAEKRGLEFLEVDRTLPLQIAELMTLLLHLVQVHEKIPQQGLCFLLRRGPSPEHGQDTPDHALAGKRGLDFDVSTMTKSRQGSQTNILPERVMGLEQAGQVMPHQTQEYAKTRAAALVTRLPIELWDGPRRVARFDPKP